MIYLSFEIESLSGIPRPGQSTEYEYLSRVKVFSEKSTWVKVKVLSSKKYSGKSKSIFKSTRVL